MPVLSIQSAVAYGYVGNAAARVVLPALGHECWTVDTVCFSNHPGYGRFTGRVVPAAEVLGLVNGLEALGVFAAANAVLSGYLGEPGSAAAVIQAVKGVRAANPKALYLCDPVIGDVLEGGATGVFVRPGVPDAIQRDLLPLTDVTSPNAFELGFLTGGAAPADVPAAVAAARTLIARGPKLVLVTSHIGADVPADSLDTLAVTADGAWRVRTPRLGLRFDGAGDTLSALFLADLMDTGSAADALSSAVSRLQPVLAATTSPRHLALVASLAAVRSPPERFSAETL